MRREAIDPLRLAVDKVCAGDAEPCMPAGTEEIAAIEGTGCAARIPTPASDTGTVASVGGGGEGMCIPVVARERPV